MQDLNFSLREYSDPRGSLVVAEHPVSLPFEVRRWFLVHAVPPGARRGEHAHRVCSQMLVAIHGAVKVEFFYNGRWSEVRLSEPQKGLLLPPMTWAVQSHFTSDAKLLVLASHEYEESDYISEFSEFLKLKQSKSEAEQREIPSN